VKKPSQSKFLGEFEIVVLASLLRLGDDAYGVSVIKEIEERIGRLVSIGAVYSTLSRLEKKSYVTTRTGEPTAERGGRAKRYFKITAEGQYQLNKSALALHRALDGLSVLPGGSLA